MSSNGSQNSLIQFTGWLARKLMWGILILLVLAGLGGAGYWLYNTDVTHVILQCEWERVDQNDPTGPPTTDDRQYILKKERLGDQITALFRPKLDLDDESEIQGIGKEYDVRSQNQEEILFGEYDESEQHRFMRKTGDLFYRNEESLKWIKVFAENDAYYARRLEQFDDAGWKKALGCKTISQSDLDRAIASRVEKIRAEQKF